MKASEEKKRLSHMRAASSRAYFVSISFSTDSLSLRPLLGTFCLFRFGL